MLAGTFLSRSDLILIYSRVPNKLVFAVVTSPLPRLPLLSVYVCMNRVGYNATSSPVQHPFHPVTILDLSSSFLFAHRRTGIRKCETQCFLYYLPSGIDLIFASCFVLFSIVGCAEKERERERCKEHKKLSPVRAL